jgi:hypothetical protein
VSFSRQVWLLAATGSAGAISLRDRARRATRLIDWCVLPPLEFIRKSKEFTLSARGGRLAARLRVDANGASDEKQKMKLSFKAGAKHNFQRKGKR